tara:strand:+ start:2592 stop:3866 length:1275 start_codon:yes stop_codon:yes gene_type:complete
MRDANNPLEVDAVVIDEVSMLDLHLANSLFAALPPTAKVLLVGDPDQLPSVGAGSVLRDLIESSTVPVAWLSTIVRQHDSSAIVKGAHSINRGHIPGKKIMVDFHSTDALKGEFVWLSENCAEDGAESIAGKVMDFIESRGYDLSRDVQVLSPMMKGETGCNALNELLRQRLNAEHATSNQKWGFVLNDRCMVNSNDYDKGVFNGEVAFVRNFKANKFIDFEFSDKRSVLFGQRDLKNVSLAYACSVHKSQGNEFPVIIMPVFREHLHLLSRELIYTGLTRAKSLAVFVGQRSALQVALKKQQAGVRQTGLTAILQDGSDEVRGTNLMKDEEGHLARLWDSLDLDVALHRRAQSITESIESYETPLRKEAGISSETSWKFKSSSSNETYTVTLVADNVLHCDCPGFLFRKSCKHVQEIAKKWSK